MISEIKFKTNLAKVEEKMEQACVMSGRDKSEVKLLPVTKNWPMKLSLTAKTQALTELGKIGCRKHFPNLQIFLV